MSRNSDPPLPAATPNRPNASLNSQSSDEIDNPRAHHDSKSEASDTQPLLKLCEDQRAAFIHAVMGSSTASGHELEAASEDQWARQARILFNNALKKGQITAPLELVELYQANVDPRLHRDVDRMIQTVAFYIDKGVTPKQLQALLNRTETWQSGRVWGQGLTVFTAGFFLLSAYQYINARHGDALVGSHDPARADVERFVWGCLIAGFGGVFGSNIIGKAGLQPGYFTPLAFDQDGKAYKDGKAIDFTSSWRGKFTEYISFWGFSVGHSVVEAMFKDHPKDAVGKAAAKWASACAATLATCLTKQYLPRLMLARDSMLLDASTPEKRAKISALLDNPSTQEGCSDLGDYLSSFGKGLKANFGCPSTPELARAVLHSLSAAVALLPMLVAKIRPEHNYEIALPGSIFIGLYWGIGSRVARTAIEQIKQAGVDAARAQERSRGAQEKETKETQARTGDGIDLEQAHATVELTPATHLQAQGVAPAQPRARRCCDCVIV